MPQAAGVDHTQYDTTSIPATIERRWGLPPLRTRDALAKDFAATLSGLHPAGQGHPEGRQRTHAAAASPLAVGLEHA